MGFLATPVDPVVATALQSFKEPEDRLVSFERGFPLRRALGYRCERSGVTTVAVISSSVDLSFRVSPPDASRRIA
jgi:hypothetical protein